MKMEKTKVSVLPGFLFSKKIKIVYLGQEISHEADLIQRPSGIQMIYLTFKLLTWKPAPALQRADVAVGRLVVLEVGHVAEVVAEVVADTSVPQRRVDQFLTPRVFLSLVSIRNQVTI